MTEVLTTLASNPNAIYLALIVCLWLAITAIYVPGTIINEVLSFGLAVWAVSALTQMPTNWVAVVAMVLGIASFVALPFAGLRWANIADVGLLLQLGGGMFLFNDGVSVSPAINLVAVLVAWAYHRFVLLPVLRRQAAKNAFDDSNAVLGVKGRVTETINPVGAVIVNGEIWTARADEVLERGMEVVVVDKVGLELRVEKAKREETAATKNGSYA